MVGHYSSPAVANLFVKTAIMEQRPIILMKLHRLLYLANGYYMAEMALASGATVPLIDDRFEAWQYGPVCPPVHSEFAYFQRAPIIQLATAERLELQAEFILDEPGNDAALASVTAFVWTTYGQRTAKDLSLMICKPGGAWDITVQQCRLSPRRRAEIPNDLILREFRGLVRKTS